MAVLDWDAWIGQEEPPEEMAETLPPLPPPVDDEAQLRQLQKDLELDKQIAEAKKNSKITLPDFDNIMDYPDEIQLEPELIQGILRRSHKMMISAASKAGKSFMLINLALCIAAGKKFLGRFQCAQAKVLYMNLEIDPKSFMKRVDDLAKMLGLKREDYADNLKILHLRGVSVPLKDMSGALIAKMIEEYKNTRESFSALVLDPIYKITAGEENSAKDVGDFCNQLDKIAARTKCSVIFSHHHSKGDQGYKSPQDRASGSGVFARDPDAMLDMLALQMETKVVEALKNNYAVKIWTKKLNEISDNWRDGILPSGLEQASVLADNYRAIGHRTTYQMKRDKEEIDAGFDEFMDDMTPLRIEFTFREFKRMKPVNVFFRPPLHIFDEQNVLSMADFETHIPGMNRESYADRKRNDYLAFKEAVDTLIEEKGKTTYEEISLKLGMSRPTILTRLDYFEDRYERVSHGAGKKVEIYFKGEPKEEGANP